MYYRYDEHLDMYGKVPTLIVEEGISRPFYLLAVWIGLLASSRSDDESSLHCLAGLLVHPPKSIMTTVMIIIVMLMLM